MLSEATAPGGHTNSCASSAKAIWLPVAAVLLATCMVFVGPAHADDRTGTESRPTAPLFTAIPAHQSGVTMRHRLLADHPRAYLYFSGFACGSVAIGDVNGDGRPDLFFTSGPDMNRLYVQTDQALVFRDATEQSGVSGRMPGGEIPWAAGAAMVDLNHDGHLDIFACNYDTPNQLFINDGRGRFTEQAATWGLDIVDASLVPAFMDVDGSGELALYLLTNRYERPGGRPAKPPVEIVAGRPRILPEFQKYYGLKKRGLGNFHVDAVGRPDRLLVVERDAAGKRTYRDVSRQAGLAADGAHGLSATWFDYDSDGRLDLYVCNDFTDPDWLYRNEGQGPDGVVCFKNVLPETVPITTWSSMGADAADINNDGLLDLVAGDMASTTHYDAMINTGPLADRLDTLLHSWPGQTMRNTMFLNTGTGRFLETAYLSGIAQTDWTWAVKLADFDNDGRVDLFITNGSSRNYTDADSPFSTEMYVGHTDWDLLRNEPPRKEKNLAFRNVDGLRFENVSRSWGLDHLGMSYGAATGDLDGDGDLDLVVCNLDETVSIYRNEGVKDHHWLGVRLRGTASHAQGWGARVRVKTASGWRIRQMNPATGFASCNDPTLHFGLGANSTIDVVEVHWPSGRLQRVERPAANQVLEIVELTTDRGASSEPARSVPSLFVDVHDLGLDYRHRETPYDDFAREPLLPGKLSQLGPGIAVGDANVDGYDDVFLGGAAGQAGALFIQGGNGRFTRIAGSWDQDADCEDMGAVWFDVDGDGRLDLYVVSGGVEGFEGDRMFEDRLYLNTTRPGGPPRFTKAAPASLPNTRQAGSAVCAADFDADGDLDLFVGSRCIPGRYPQTPRSMLLRNDSTPGKPKLVDVADELAPGLAAAGLVTAALWSDVDADGHPDLLVVSEWGPVKLFHNQRGMRFEPARNAGLDQRTGWWNGIAAGDFDADGRLDFLITNIGLNTKYGAASPARPSLLLAGDVIAGGGYQLIEAQVGPGGLLPVRPRGAMVNAMPQLGQKFPTHRAYSAANLTEMFGADALRRSLRLAATEFRSGVLLNRSTRGQPAFVWQALPDLAHVSPSYGIATADFNGDGRIDAVLAQNLFTREPETGPWRGGLGQLLVSTPPTLRGARGGEIGEAHEPSPNPSLEGRGSVLVPISPKESGIVIPGDAKGAATLDLNNDARPDLLVAQNDNAFVSLANRSPRNWLTLRLVGANGTPAIGARVIMSFADGRTSAHELSAGSGYLSQSAAEVSIGLGGAAPQRAEIHWPGGRVQTVRLQGKSGRQMLKAPAMPKTAPFSRN